MKKFKQNGIDLDTLKSNRDTLEKRLKEIKTTLNDYISDCKRYGVSINDNVVKKLENKISKITDELKKLNSSIDSYEAILERIRKSEY